MNKDYTATIYTVVVLIVAFAFAAAFVVADPNAPLSLTNAGSTARNLSLLAAQSADARGGNVTEININTLTITKSWQGYYGNISGIVTLQDASSNTFYNWTMANTNGRVFATRVNSVSWTTVACTSGAQRTTEEGYLGQAYTDSDSVTNTFNTTTHPAFNVSTVSLTANTCYATNGYVNNNSQSSSYAMVLLNAGANIIYTALTNKSTVGFDGRQHDFQLLVSENEKTGSVGVTSYYFWTEFS